MSRFTTRALMVIALVLGATSAFAQGEFAEIKLLELRVGQLEARVIEEKTRRGSRFQTDDLEEVVDRLRTDLTDLKGQFKKLSADMDALRAEVRARDGKPGEAPTLTVRAPFAVVDKTGRALLTVSDDGTGTRVEAPLAVKANTATTFETNAQGTKTRGTVTVINAAGAEFARIESGANGSATFSMGDRRTGGILAGVGASGNGFFALNEKTGKRAIEVGTPGGAAMGIYILGADGEKPQASLGLDDAQKGILRVGDPAGMRGVLGATKSGGISFGLFDRAGADYRVGLLAAPDNSFVRLNSQKNAVHMNADGTGAAVHVFNGLGNAAASMQSTNSGYGKFSLGDADGNTMVEAGVTVDQVGIVRVGPRLGGTTGVTQGGLVLPHAIVGQKK